MSEPEPSTDVRNEYNAISGIYDRRYEINPLNGVEAALRSLIQEVGARQVLEVGCGTGHCLKTFASLVDRIMGLDSSSGMLQQARSMVERINLACGSADCLPFAEKPLDLIFVVNALHHFVTSKDSSGKPHPCCGRREFWQQQEWICPRLLGTA